MMIGSLVKQGKYVGGKLPHNLIHCLENKVRETSLHQTLKINSLMTFIKLKRLMLFIIPYSYR